MGLMDLDGAYGGTWGQPDRATVERLAGSLIARGKGEGSRVVRGVTKIKDRGIRPRLGGVLGEVPTGSLNDTVVVQIGLPLGMVEAASELGVLDEVVREAVRDYLRAKGKSWWGPRFLQMVRE